MPITKNGCKQKPSFVLEVAVHVPPVLLKRQKKDLNIKLLIYIYILNILFLYFLLFAYLLNLLYSIQVFIVFIVLVQVQTYKIFAKYVPHASTSTGTSTSSISYT